MYFNITYHDVTVEVKIFTAISAIKASGITSNHSTVKLQGYSTVEQSTSMLHTQRVPVITKDERRKPVFDSQLKNIETTRTGI